MKTHGEVELQLHAIFISVLYGVSGQFHSWAASTLGKDGQSGHLGLFMVYLATLSAAQTTGRRMVGSSLSVVQSEVLCRNVSGGTE
jgi:hypothetical protein